METLTCSLRIRTDGPPGLRPSASRVGAARAALTSLGFEVLYAGRFALTLRAPFELYATELICPVSAQGYGTFDVHPSDPVIAALVEYIEICPPAVFFSTPSA